MQPACLPLRDGVLVMDGQRTKDRFVYNPQPRPNPVEPSPVQSSPVEAAVSYRIIIIIIPGHKHYHITIPDFRE